MLHEAQAGLQVALGENIGLNIGVISKKYRVNTVLEISGCPVAWDN